MEVLLVLVILVVLMGFAVPSLLGSKKKADMDAARTQIGLFRTALEKYALDLNTFPTTEQGLDVLVVKPTDLEDDQSANWAGPYITTTTKDSAEGSLGPRVLVRVPLDARQRVSGYLVGGSRRQGRHRGRHRQLVEGRRQLESAADLREAT